MTKILFVRTAPYPLNFNSYNVQALGLGKEFVNGGFDFDFLYFPSKHKQNSESVYYSNNGNKLRIIQRKGLRFFRTGISKELFSKKFLSNYDLIITSEYNQLGSVLLSINHSNTVIYSGPYYNLFMIPYFDKIYDFLFKKIINNNSKQIYVKSKLAKEYLANKGYHDIRVVGVGLDVDKFEQPIEEDNTTIKILQFIENNPKNLLYVGSLSKRKNFSFLLDTFQEISQSDEDVRLIVIGKGNCQYVNRVLSKYDECLLKKILFIDNISNEQLKYIYPKVTALMLPSTYEIFGMVILEAMYFGCPVITSKNGGSCTLLNDDAVGFMLKDFDSNLWTKTYFKILKNSKLREEISEKSSALIKNRYTWKSIMKIFVKEIDNKE